MARTWFAGYAPAPIVPPSRDAVTKTGGGDPAPSSAARLSKDKIAVPDFATAHPITPRIKATRSGSDLDGRVVTWITPFTAPPQKEPNDQQTAKETIDASAYLARLVQQHSKPKEPRRATTSKSKDSTTSKPVGTVAAFAPSLSAPPRAPTAQMLPLPSNAAVTTATPAAAVASPKTLTTSLFRPHPRTMSASNPQAFFPGTAPTSLSSSPSWSIPSISSYSPPTASPERYAPKQSAPKRSTMTPQITLTPAPGTAPSAFKDAALAAHVQNTKLLSPAKPPTNGVKKRQYIKKNRSPLHQSSSTPEPAAPEEKRGAGRPRTRVAEQPHQQGRQHRLPVQTYTPSSYTYTPSSSTSLSNQYSSSSLSTLSTTTLATQHDFAVALRSNSASKPDHCSEEPRLWPRRGDDITSLLRFDSRPETIHSAPIEACSNRAAHPSSQDPRGHGVCTTCRHGAYRHIKATRQELFGSAWWPLCRPCGDREMLRFEPGRNGCSCYDSWLCFSCLTEVVERRSAMVSVEAQFRRRTLVGEGSVENVSRLSVESQFLRTGPHGEGTLENVGTAMTGWACECGMEIGPDTTLMKCIGCQGMRVGRLDLREAAAREASLRKTALAWT